MTNEELLYIYQNEEDLTKKKQVLDELFKKNIRLINKEVGKTPYAYWGTYDDTFQEISTIFIKCAKKFDTTSKYKFSTYFVKACGFERSNRKRKFTKDSNNTFHIELEDMIGGEDLHDMDEVIDNQRDGQRATVKLLELYNEGKVTELQFITVIQKFGLFGIHAQNRRDIAQRRGCTVQNIDALYKKAVSVVRDKMEQEDLENHD